jgi:small-conductance mechanosensitive channel
MIDDLELERVIQALTHNKVRAAACNLLCVFMIALMAIFSFSKPWVYAAEEADPIGPVDSVEYLAESMENALASERARLSDLKERFRRLEKRQDEVKINISIYETQNTAHENLFLISQIDSEDIEKALLSNRLAVKALNNSVKTFLGKWEKGSVLLQQVEDRISLGEKQLVEIRQTKLTDTDSQKLVDLNKEFLSVLAEEKEIVVRYANIYQSVLNQMKTALIGQKEMGQRLEILLSDWAKEYLFTRTDLFRDLFSEDSRSEMRGLVGRLAAPFTSSGMRVQWERIKLSGSVQWTVFLVLLALTIAVQSKARRGLEHIEQRIDDPQWRHCHLALQLLRRSMMLVSLALFFTLCYVFNWTLFNIGLAWFLSHLLQLLVFRRWGLDYFKFGLDGPPTPLQTFVVTRLQRFIRITWPAIIFILAITWFAGRGSPLTTLATLILSVWILFWTIFFWRAVPSAVTAGVRDGQAAPAPKILNLLRGWSFLVSMGALLLGMTGYVNLVKFWMISWIYAVIAVLWAWISFQAIREYRLYSQSQVDRVDITHPTRSMHHLRWALVQIIWVVWFFGFAAIFVRIWDRTGYVTTQLVHLIDKTLSIGSLAINLKSILLAVLIIFLTHFVNRIGRSLLAEKALETRELERGLKDSILTIASYLIWGLGLVMALGTLGVNATSLAVVFGAISIGIGFGLQNIFNNFISGLILLFERPIQVGDYVEVNGLWAEVKKINVRSTVVQTFDNASVIIPNSEFISQQVTNWSFKDLRMRRNVDVGVAYESDIELVRKTLLEIAAETPDILKYPRPDVLFVDHGDSALIFRLRVWTNVDNYWSVTSAIRFELDKRFRALDIEIAFPQRDVHIRSITKAQESSPPLSHTSE